MEGFKKTEIGLLPKDWSAARIKEMYKLNNEQITQSNIPYKEFYYIDLSSVKNGVVTIPQDKILIEEAPSRAKRVLRLNDVIIATVRPNLKGFAIANFDTNKMICSTGFALVKTKNELDAAYLFQNLFSHNITNQIENLVVGSNYPAISNSDVENLIIPKPPLPEQQKIATILSKWDETIEAQTQLIKVKGKQKTSLMQKLLTGEVRFPGFEEEWKILPIGKLTKIYDGTHSTPTYTKFGIPFYSVESITQDDFTNTKFISEEVFEKENKRVKLERGDILMTRIGDIGTAKMLSWDVKASFYVSLALIKKSDKFNSKYLEQYIGSNLFQSELHKRTIHVAFPKKINLGEISDCLVKLPSMKEQDKIAEILNSCDEEIKSLKTELEALKIQKKGLMQQLLTGKIRVKV